MQDRPTSRIRRDQAFSRRQQRERAYYEEFPRPSVPEQVTFDPVRGVESRPWNSYWFLYEFVRRQYCATGQQLLDFGCGAGVPGLRFASLGYEVHGFDLSPRNVTLADRLAQRYGLQDRTHFSVQVAERLDYPTDCFDIVAGIDILHHVEIRSALHEVRRVLKPGGVAVFREPIEAPVLDRIRNTRLVRWLAPNDESFDTHITEDERKLSHDDVAAIRATLPAVEIHPFALLARFNRFVANSGRLSQATLEKVDQRLFRAFPSLRKYAGCAVLILRKQ